MKLFNAIILTSIIFVAGCDLGGKKKESKKAFVSHYSESYKPLVFNNPDRESNIQAVLPILEELFEGHAKSQDYPGFTYGVIVGDSLMLKGSSGTISKDSEIPVTSTSVFRIASLTKSFTAMAILKLRDEGRLRLNTPVSVYISELENLKYLTSDSPEITIKQLLTMTSGFPEDNPWADQQLESTGQQFAKLLEGSFSFSSIPNVNYEYSNLGYALLGEIITRVSGVKYQDYITSQILHPLEMKSTYWEYEQVPADKLVIGYRWENEEWKEEPMLHDGAFGAIGGLMTSLEDYAKYVSFHLSAWPANSSPEAGPVRRSSLREMHMIHSPARLHSNAKDIKDQPCPVITGYGYGLGIFENCKGVKRVNHSGGLPGFGTEYRFYPEYGIGIISFISKTYAPAGDINNQIFTILMEQTKLQSRSLPISDILNKRKNQIVDLIKTWDVSVADEILADNFFKDRPRNLRMRDAGKILKEAGDIVSEGEIVPHNQLRGTFILKGTKADIEIFFSLSPEASPKVQRLNLRLKKKRNF